MAPLALAAARGGFRQSRRGVPPPIAKCPAAGSSSNGRGDGAATSQEQGLFCGIRQRPQAAPGDRSGAQPRASRLAPSSKEAIRARSGSKYERPDNRIADIEQFALLAAKYDSLERLIADLLLAGDVYGMDSVASDEPGEVLVLSTVHQAKGLEWSHVFVPRLVEESFPHRRALDETGGEDEERRIFYVAVTRAMNELTLTYPLTMARGGRGPTTFTMPSRFLTEIDASLVEHW